MATLNQRFRPSVPTKCSSHQHVCVTTMNTTSNDGENTSLFDSQSDIRTSSDLRSFRLHDMPAKANSSSLV